jgi:hypothetical protein
MVGSEGFIKLAINQKTTIQVEMAKNMIEQITTNAILSLSVVIFIM